MIDPQWEKLNTLLENEGENAALTLIYQWVKTNVISKPDFIHMVKSVFDIREDC